MRTFVGVLPHDCAMTLRSRYVAALVALPLAGALGGCADSGGAITVTSMDGGCSYGAAEGGIPFTFSLTGDKDADMVAEVHQQAKPGASGDHPGQVIASKTLSIDQGDYDNPVTIVVPLKQSQFIAKRTTCILQTDNRGPDVISP